MFSPEDRDRLRDYVVDKAHADERVVAAAVVGSFASGEGDRFSDVDLTFGVADGISLGSVMDEWTADLKDRFEAVRLFDLEVGSIVYRVFLLPDCLQLDLSFAPASEFAATSPRFELLFGDAKRLPAAPAPDSADVLGWAVLYAKDARINIERGRTLQAAYIIATLRHQALDLACLRHGLPTRYGKGYDELPGETTGGIEETFPHSLDLAELRRALAAAVDLLVEECSHHEAGTPEVIARLRDAVA